jgi:serpin B
MGFPWHIDPEGGSHMLHPRWLLAAALAALLAAAGMSEGQFVRLTDDARTVAQDGNVFGLDLYSQLRQKDGNLFLSPYSISSALSMTCAGARGQTAAEMAATLHFHLPADRQHAGAGVLTKYLNAKGPGGERPYQLSVANALWGQKGYSFLPTFVQLTENLYGAKLSELDFAGAPDESRQIINRWVEKKTNDKIKDLIPPGSIKPITRLVLTNAIYFKSPWQNKFAKSATRQEDFTRTDGSKVKAPLMAKFERAAYLNGGTFQAFSIPYQAYALSMVVLLPKEAGGLSRLEKELTAAQLDQILKKMTTHDVNLKLPRFKVTSEFSLRKTLTAMGMASAFDTDKADFRGMTTQEKLFISEVIHKAFVDVNEDGTEAAAATAVIMLGGGVPRPVPRANFHADHPFLFLIRENRTGSILFLGRVNDPTK